MRFIIIFVMHLNSTLSKKILAWYDNSKRNLPWRVGKKSPKKLYYRLLSEFMLQQTQVKTVIPYFNNFTKKFKTLHSLSKSNEKEILKMWEGLGYYRRARNLLACSKELVNKYNSKLPNKLEELKKSPVAKTAEAVVTKKSIGTLGGAAIGATLGGSLGIAGKFLGVMVFINGAWVLAPVGGILGYYAAKKLAKKKEQKLLDLVIMLQL